MKKIFALLAGLVLIAGCAVKTDVQTAREFVESYSKAYANKDIDAIIKMSVQKDIDTANLRSELESGFKTDDMWADAWKNTKYESEEKQKGYIRVKVKVKGYPSEIVLVEENGFLRIHPNPSSFVE